MSVYGKGYFTTEKIDEKAMMESMLLEAANEGLYSIVEADYTILPVFKKTPALRKYENVAKEAEDLLAEKGVDDKAYGIKIARMIVRIFDIINNATSILGLIGCLTIANIPIYLISRLVIWALRWGQEKLAIEECKKTIVQYRKLLKKAESKTEKDKIENCIKKVEEAKEKLEKSSKQFNIKISED